MTKTKYSLLLMLCSSMLFVSLSCSMVNSISAEEREIQKILTDVRSDLIEKKYDVSDVVDEGTFSCSDSNEDENVIYDSKFYHSYLLRLLSSGRPYQQSVVDIQTVLDAYGVQTEVNFQNIYSPLTGKKGNIFFYLATEGELQLTFTLMATTGCY